MPDLKTRCVNLLTALDLPKTRFCKNIKISDLNLAESTTNRIDKYLNNFNF